MSQRTRNQARNSRGASRKKTNQVGLLQELTRWRRGRPHRGPVHVHRCLPFQSQAFKQPLLPACSGRRSPRGATTTATASRGHATEPHPTNPPLISHAATRAQLARERVDRLTCYTLAPDATRSSLLCYVLRSTGTSIHGEDAAAGDAPAGHTPTDRTVGSRCQWTAVMGVNQPHAGAAGGAPLLRRDPFCMLVVVGRLAERPGVGRSISTQNIRRRATRVIPGFSSAERVKSVTFFSVPREYGPRGSVTASRKESRPLMMMRNRSASSRACASFGFDACSRNGDD